ncbi:hypothetical protein CMZ84_00765 [Lysobacteraceae bacterium NML93-0399]|nr:hypothetical protein CMZ84_00765 [Xanthomonadaceae bacterium NML93-0399]
MRIGLLAACLAAVTAMPASAQDYEVLFEVLDDTVRTRFYDPHFAGRDWDAISAQYQARLPEVRDDVAFRRLGQGMLDALGVSHVSLHPPGSEGPTFGLAVRTEEIDGQAVVVEIDPASASRGAGLRIGDRILDTEAIRGPREQPAQLDVERCDGSQARLSVPRESAFWPPRERTISWACCAVAMAGPSAI